MFNPNQYSSDGHHGYKSPYLGGGNLYTAAHPAMAASAGLLAKQTLTRPVQFRSLNLVSVQQSANMKWASPDAVNFMDHLYFITNLVLDYLLENELPSQLMNQTLLDNPAAVLLDNRNELTKHFHKLLIAACTCLCIGISIPLFGFMIACCMCGRGSSKRPSGSRSRSSSQGRHRSRSRHRDSPDADWLALSVREPAQSGPYRNGRLQQDVRRRHGRSASGTSVSSHYRSRSLPPSLRFESGCHPCLRTFFSSHLFIALLLIAFFAVCAFVTNEYVNNGVKHLPRVVNQSMDDVQSYLNNTDQEVGNLFRANYNQLENEINLRLDTGGLIIKHKLAVASEAIALVNLTDIVIEFNDTKVRLERLDRELLVLKSRLNTARIGLTNFRTSIENCPFDQCPLLRRKYQNLDNFRILPQYERLPDVKNLIKKVTQLLDSGIIAQVQRGKDDFERVGAIIQSEISKTSPDIKLQLGVIGKKLSGLASDVSQSIRWSDHLLNQTRGNSKKLNQLLKYEQYRHYGSLAGASVILFVLVCFTLGWLFGACRPQPTARTYKTRTKTSTSSSFPFACGIFTVFLVFLPLILSAIVLFMTGSVGDKIVCRIIKHPEQKQSRQIYAMVQNKFINANLSLESTEIDKVTIELVDGREHKVYRPNYADLVARCHQNQSIYKVLRLDRYDKLYLADDGRNNKISISIDNSFNLNSAQDFKRINNLDKKFRDLIKKLDLDLSKVTLLSKSAEEILSNSMSLSFDDIELSFSRLYDNAASISPIDIEQLIKDIHLQKAAVSGTETEASLTWASIQATSFQEHVLPNITSSLLNLKDGIRHLKLRMFHGRNSYGTVIQELIARVRSAEMQLKSNGNALMRVSANEFVNELIALIDQYANHVRNQVENVIGQCEPVSRAINSTAASLCDDIVLPYNGYWLSIVASLMLILPATLLAYALKGLYSLAKRGLLQSYSYTDPGDEISFDDDGEDSTLAYHLGHTSHKPPASLAPSAPMIADDNWSPSSSSYNSRPPPYAI